MVSLSKKLGIKEGFSVLIYNEPKPYKEFFSELTTDLRHLKSARKETADFIHIFVTEMKDLERNILKYKNALKKNGLMWISWPKGASKIISDLKRDPIREYGLSIGLVDVKIASVDEDWSALKFVYRTKDR